jgi:hypothetical protein
VRDIIVWEDAGMSEAGGAGPKVKVYTPEQIAERAGGISVKSLSAVIRDRGLETTTLGYVQPSRKGGRRRRLWGMTGAQLEALLASRRRRS